MNRALGAMKDWAHIPAQHLGVRVLTEMLCRHADCIVALWLCVVLANFSSQFNICRN